MARAGATIGIAVGGGCLVGAEIGYGAPVYQAQDVCDTQRGSIQIELSRDGVVELVAPRLVTRVRPDPATLFAMDPSLAGGGMGVNAGMGRVLALVELPVDLAAGTWQIEFERFDGNGNPATPAYSSSVNLPRSRRHSGYAALLPNPSSLGPFPLCGGPGAEPRASLPNSAGVRFPSARWGRASS